MSNQRVGTPIDRNLQDHLVVRIGKLWPPREPHIDWLARGCERGEGGIHLRQRQTCGGAMLWALQHAFVFQEQRRTCKRYDLTLGDQGKQSVYWRDSKRLPVTSTEGSSPNSMEGKQAY